jgi:hypothetical protein
LDADAEFCTFCGTAVSSFINCPNCQRSITAHAKFCKYCALELSNLQSSDSAAQEKGKDDHPASLISPAAAVFAIICFFLPWTQMSCGDKTVILSGADWGGFYWFVPLMAILIIAVYLICKRQQVLFYARPFIIGSAIIALGFLGYLYYSAFGDKDIQFKSGFVGSVLGFVLAGAGCVFMSRPLKKANQNVSDEEPKIC